MIEVYGFYSQVLSFSSFCFSLSNMGVSLETLAVSCHCKNDIGLSFGGGNCYRNSVFCIGFSSLVDSC